MAGMKTQNRCDLCGSSSHDRRYRFHDLDVLKCRECGLVFIEMHDPDLLPKDVYDPDYFNDRGEYFLHVSDQDIDQVTGSHMDSFRQGLELLRKYKGGGGKLLDVGCAVGVFLSMAENRGWNVTGVDISEYAVSQARKKCGGEVFSGDLAELRFTDASFDVITLWDVVEHFSRPSETLREAHRILKDDGIILMDTPNEEALIRKVAYRIYQLLGGRIAYPAEKLYHLYHLFYFSEKTLTRLLDKCGFEAIEVIRKPIPLEKGRGTRLERYMVKALGALERPLGMDYEILIMARKKR
jgi:2-polyprenyl-3-methyl-5-hydroxy-6-metoxy-1,4-benzoquinol methylase